MLGFGALGEFAIGEADEMPPMPRWAAPSSPSGDIQLTVVVPPPRIITD